MPLNEGHVKKWVLGRFDLIDPVGKRMLNSGRKLNSNFEIRNVHK